MESPTPLYVFDLLSGVHRPITEDGFKPDWSPSGNLLSYFAQVQMGADHPFDGEVVVANVESGSSVELGHYVFGVYPIGWAAHGSVQVYDRWAIDDATMMQP